MTWKPITETLKIPLLREPRRKRIRGDRAVVFGGAKCVLKDAQKLFEMYGTWDGLVVAVNDIGIQLPYLDAWATLHPENMKRTGEHPEKIGWKEQRRRLLGDADEYKTWSRREADTDRTMAHNIGGSSGLLGALVARKITGEGGRVVLLGIPMTKTPHFAQSRVHPPDKAWGSSFAHWRVWVNDSTVTLLTGRVRSMSGQTRQLLGEPTLAWLKGEEV